MTAFLQPQGQVAERGVASCWRLRDVERWTILREMLGAKRRGYSIYVRSKPSGRLAFSSQQCLLHLTNRHPFPLNPSGTVM